MPVNITSPANLLPSKDHTIGLFIWSFVKNMKAFTTAGVIGTQPDAIFQLDLSSLEPYMGQYADVGVLRPIANLVTKRDYANGGNAATVLTIGARNDNGVRCVYKAGPVNIGEDAGKISIYEKRRLIEHFAEQAGKEAAVYMQRYLFGAAKAAIAGMTDAVHTHTVWVASAGTKVNLSASALQSARFKLGDRANEFFGKNKGLLVLHSAQELDLSNSQVAAATPSTSDSVINGGTVATLGAPYFSFDDVDITGPNGTDPYKKYQALLLGPGFARVKLELPEYYAPDQRVDTESVSNLYRMDSGMTIEIPGFAWDKTNGGANPDFTAIATSTNWDPNYDDHREVLGALAETNSSLA